MSDRKFTVGDAANVGLIVIIAAHLFSFLKDDSDKPLTIIEKIGMVVFLFIVIGKITVYFGN